MYSGFHKWKFIQRMEKGAVCKTNSKDEIGILADNINHLYKSLLSAIESLEIEKQRVSESERSKADFLRAASHELNKCVIVVTHSNELAEKADVVLYLKRGSLHMA